MIEWDYLAKKYRIEGARSRFEEICATLLSKKFSDQNVKSPRVSSGDGGIDIFIGQLGNPDIKVYQCKFFLKGIASSQKQQIRESFRRVILAKDYKSSSWTLCLPIQLSKEEHIWFSEWKTRQEYEFHLGKNFIKLLDGLDIIQGLKEYGLYDEVFDEELKRDIALLIERTAPKVYDLKAELARGSNFISGLKSYFSGNSKTHLVRSQTGKILEWIKSERKGKDNLENVLVIKGKKGVGKSTVISDAYRELDIKGEHYLLAIKCDQYYDINTEDLSKQLFSAGISFDDIFSTAEASGTQIIVFLDQLDALSQTLSTDRRWLKTYLTLIDYLLLKKNIRIILSTRSFDLDYDADLLRFSDQQKVKHLEVDILSSEDVDSVLEILRIEVKNKHLLELLKIPYNLELFSKIPDLSGLLKRSTEINISRLHVELYSQLLTTTHLKITACLDQIVQRIYSGLPNMIEQQYMETFIKEIDFLISQGILLKHGTKLSFFHQSFYEYYLARWFVDGHRDLTAYIFEQEQNLYIRALIKNVIDYLREADHSGYISLYQSILANEKIRYHIRYLFIIDLGQVEDPTEREKQFVYKILDSEHGKLFMEVFTSSGWLIFLLENELLQNDVNALYPIFYRNLKYQPKMVLEFIESKGMEGGENLIANLLPNIDGWDSELVPYFERYYNYSEQNELWYFEILKKVAIVDMEFVLNKLKPIFLAQRKNNERMKFDYRYDRIVEHLFKIDPKVTAEFLLEIQMEILEGTQHDYYGHYENISSPLLASRNYDNDLYYKESSDEKSIESFLLRYYGRCDKAELHELFLKYCETNYVPFLSLLIKLLRDRADEFVTEIFLLLKIIDRKNGLKGTDDFFSLQIRRLIAASILLFEASQYVTVKTMLLEITHPHQIYSLTNAEGKKKVKSRIGQKKYLFLKALPDEIIKNDADIRKEYQVLQRRYGEMDHNIPLERSGMRWGGGQSPLNNPNFDKFSHEAWLASMRKIHEGFKHDDFMRGDILEHSRSFEQAVEKRPEYFYDFIDSLFDKDGVSPRYISYGISALIKAKDNIEKTAELINKEIELSFDREYTNYAIWHSRFLIEHKLIAPDIIDFWVKIARWEPHKNDILNPGQEISDFINTPRGSAVDNLMHLGEFPEYAPAVFETIEFIIRAAQIPTKTLSCGIMLNIAYLNSLDNNRAFEIFKHLVMYKDVDILKHSIQAAQYYNNIRHDQMDFYFKQVLQHPEMYENCYFFVTSWIFERIDDYEMYDGFMKLGGKAFKCAMTVAEKLLIGEDGIDDRCIQVLQRCLDQKSEDLSHEFSSLILRRFKPNYFLQLYNFINNYVFSVHFAKDPRYLFEYLVECAALHPCECLELLCKMNLPFHIDIRETAYLGDEPLILVLAIYSKLRNFKFKYVEEQKKALDQFDKMLSIPSIRIKALEAMESVLN